jgi:hypothetical protein
MLPPKIKSIQVLEEMRLLVGFANDMQKVYDCSQLLKFEAFKPLQNEAFFRSVKVDPGGYGISWNDDIDLSEYELWTNSIEPSQTEQKTG